MKNSYRKNAFIDTFCGSGDIYIETLKRCIIKKETAVKYELDFLKMCIIIRQNR